MDGQDRSVLRRFEDLALQADRRGVVVFSDFLTLYERRLLQAHGGFAGVQAVLYGGYKEAERQVAAFVPDALSYEWEFPVACLSFVPSAPRFAETLTHRDMLGALMNLGIERRVLGDIVFPSKNQACVFCLEKIADFLLSSVTLVRHTAVTGTLLRPEELSYRPSFRDAEGVIASNRLDAFVAEACRLPRSKTAAYILGDNAVGRRYPVAPRLWKTGIFGVRRTDEKGPRQDPLPLVSVRRNACQVCYPFPTKEDPAMIL